MLEENISKLEESGIKEKVSSSSEADDSPVHQDFSREDQDTGVFKQTGGRNPINVNRSSTDQPWNIPAAISVWLISVISVIFIPGLFIISYAQYKKIEATGSQGFSELLQKDQTVLILNLIAIIPAHLLTLLFAWVVVTGFKRRPFFQTLGWQWRGVNYSQALSVVLVFNALAFLLFALIPESRENEFQKLILSSKLAFYLTAVMAVSTAPLVEEIVYRGILYPAFERSFGISKAIVLVSLLFGLVHVPQYYPSYVTIFLIFTLSVVLTVIRAYTKNLFLCVFLHTLHNLFQVVFMVIQSWLEKSFTT